MLARISLGIMLAAGASAIDNGLGITPPRGWRSWNLFRADINDTIMRGQMDAVVDATRMVDGKPTTLASLGFKWVSMDDGWQKCNCSTGGSIDPALPTCGNCRSGSCSWHSRDGRPVVNTDKFPNMTALVEYGHNLSLKVGSYLNNCICMEGGDPPMGLHCTSPTHYEEDVDFIVKTGFDGVKIDNCGSSHNVTRWAQLFNRTGKHIRIESCHTFHPNHGTPSGWPNFPVWDPASRVADTTCPMNFYRTGGDVGASFSSVIGEAYATVQYADRTDPFSRPGCWSYPDMQEIGNFQGADPLRTDEEMSHWGLWCIISAPLILGTDLRDKVTMDRIWSTITNPEALAINAAWTGEPGTLVKSYPATNISTDLTIDQVSRGCDGRPGSSGWVLSGGKLHGPTDVATEKCLEVSSGPPGQTTQQESSCPPPTRGFPSSGCGHTFVDCAKATGTWFHAGNLSSLTYSQNDSDGGSPKCLHANPAAGVGGFYGGPKAAITAVGSCTSGNSTSFTFTDAGELVAGTGACLVARRLYGVQLWSKQLPGKKVAVLAVNIAQDGQEFSLPLDDVPGVSCGGPTGCAVRDVWARKDLSPQRKLVPLTLRVHQSAFLVLTSSTQV